MTTQFLAKFAALGVALMINGMMIGAVAYLFSSQLHRPSAMTERVGGSQTQASTARWLPTL